MAEKIRYGVCTNKTQCSLAFNHETVIVPPDRACPECGRPLKVNTMFSRFLRTLMLLIVLAALGAGGYYVYKNYLGSGQFDPRKLIGALDTPAKTPPEKIPANGVSPTPGSTDSGNPATPTPSVGPVSNPDFEASTANTQARKDVLKRIDVMPHLTDQQKAKLTDAVARARNMGCIFIIPFKEGQRSLDGRGTDLLVGGFKSAALQQLLKDPTVVFVVLGYSDKTGDQAANERISLDRAQNVLMAMKDRCGVLNVTYSVAMGGSDMFDGKSSTKNRLVEVWAAFP